MTSAVPPPRGAEIGGGRRQRRHEDVQGHRPVMVTATRSGSEAWRGISWLDNSWRSHPGRSPLGRSFVGNASVTSSRASTHGSSAGSCLCRARPAREACGREWLSPRRRCRPANSSRLETARPSHPGEAVHLVCLRMIGPVLAGPRVRGSDRAQPRRRRGRLGCRRWRCPMAYPSGGWPGASDGAAIPAGSLSVRRLREIEAVLGVSIDPADAGLPPGRSSRVRRSRSCAPSAGSPIRDPPRRAASGRGGVARGAERGRAVRHRRREP